MKAWTRANRDKVRAAARERRSANLEEHRRKAREYWRANKDKKAAQRKRYNERYPERVLEAKKRWKRTERGRAMSRAITDRQRAAWPQRMIARRMVRDALAQGRLIRPPFCARCFGTGRIEAHHPSYEPGDELKVVWLCKACHTTETFGRYEPTHSVAFARAC